MSYTLDTLQPGLLVAYNPKQQLKVALLQISTIYPPTDSGTGYATATVLIDHDGKPPRRTTVRSYLPNEIAKFTEPSKQAITKMDEHYFNPQAVR